MSDVGADAVIELVGFVNCFAVAADPFVSKSDEHPGVEVGEFTEPTAEDFVVEVGVGEDGGVGLEGYARAGSFFTFGQCCDDVQWVFDFSAFEGDEVYFSVSNDFDFHPFGEGVDARDADSVESAGDFVCGVVKFSSGVEDGHDDFDGGFPVEVRILMLHWFDGDASAVVDNGDGAVGHDLDVAFGGATGHGFVDGVIDGFPDEVMEAVEVGPADVHTGAFSYGFESFEDLDVGGFVAGVIGGCIGMCVGGRLGIDR